MVRRISWGRYVAVIILLISSVHTALAQFVNPSRNPVYLPVFSVTDDFDSSYLTILSSATQQQLPDTVILAMGNDLAYYWHTRNLDSAHAKALHFLSLARQLHQEIWEGRLETTLGAILLRQEKLDSAFMVLESARKKLPKRDWPPMLTQMGYVFERKGNLGRAADYAMEGLKLGDTLKDARARAMAYSDLSNLFWKQSKFDKGLEYGLQSEKIFTERGISDMDFSFTLYVIGNNYMDLKDFPNALRYYQRALLMSNKYQFYNNLADIHISLSDLYMVLGDFRRAEFNTREAIRYSALLNNNFMLMRSWLSLGKLQNVTGQPDSALHSLQICLATATEKFGDGYFLHQAYGELGKAYAATGDYKKAYTAFLTHDQLEDSLFTLESDQRVARLQTEFDVAQKETTIRSQEKSISQQKKLQWVTMGAASLLVFILLVLFRNYRNKQRVNATLEKLNHDLEEKNIQLDKRNAENELLLKEIHHRVKNNLEIVSGLLALQAAQTDHPSAQAIMQASQNRVLSMGIIHQRLYQKGNLAAIEMKDYFKNLGESILDTFSAAGRVVIETPMEPLELDIDTAVPIGLIANELLTNALKYAFAGMNKGIIQISIVPGMDGREYMMTVSDNGIGNTELDTPKGTGFGTELVHLLVQQLGGKLVVSHNPGTRVNIFFTPAMTIHGNEDKNTDS